LVWLESCLPTRREWPGVAQWGVYLDEVQLVLCWYGGVGALVLLQALIPSKAHHKVVAQGTSLLKELDVAPMQDIIAAADKHFALGHPCCACAGLWPDAVHLLKRRK
jgi:hypothetical protein